MSAVLISTPPAFVAEFVAEIFARPLSWPHSQRLVSADRKGYASSTTAKPSVDRPFIPFADQDMGTAFSIFCGHAGRLRCVAGRAAGVFRRRRNRPGAVGGRDLASCLRSREGDRVAAGRPARRRRQAGAGRMPIEVSLWDRPVTRSAESLASAPTSNGPPKTRRSSAAQAILMTIYATGVGAHRNPDLAIRFACTLDGAPAEMEGRIAHLQKLKASARRKLAFDLCDDITSGFMMGACAAHAQRIEEAKRTAQYRAKLAGWTAPERAAFAKLRQAARTFFQARSSNEVDLSGTAQAEFEVKKTNVSSSPRGVPGQAGARRGPASERGRVRRCGPRAERCLPSGHERASAFGSGNGHHA